MSETSDIKQTLFATGVEYFSHGFFVLLAFMLYSQLPYYVHLLTPQGEYILTDALIGYLGIAPVYFFGKHLFFPTSYKENKSLIVIVYIVKSFPKMAKLFSSVPTKKEFLALSLDPTTRTAILSIIVKFFYIPLMLSFFLGQLSSVLNILPTMPSGNYFSSQNFINWTYNFLYNLIFTIDTGTFLFGYAFEAKWLKNQIKSVDPHLSGWLFALICYPPFNSAIGSFSQTNQQSLLFPFLQTSQIALIMKICILFLYTMYVWASVALFTKASNLTNRGIISRGPYRFIRHPAYAMKNIAWWFEQLPYFTSWIAVAFLLFWNGVYIMRALTEERHLLADPDYQVYAKKVKYRFIPFVI